MWTDPTRTPECGVHPTYRLAQSYGQRACGSTSNEYGPTGQPIVLDTESDPIVQRQPIVLGDVHRPAILSPFINDDYVERLLQSAQQRIWGRASVLCELCNPP